MSEEVVGDEDWQPDEEEAPEDAKTEKFSEETSKDPFIDKAYEFTVVRRMSSMLISSSRARTITYAVRSLVLLTKTQTRTCARACTHTHTHIHRAMKTGRKH